MKKFNLNNVITYQTKSGAIEFKGDLGNDTIWANLDQISNLFGRDKSVISRHIKNLFKEKELVEEISCCIFLQQLPRMEKLMMLSILT